MKEIPGKPEKVHPLPGNTSPYPQEKKIGGQREAFGKILSEHLTPSPGSSGSSSVSKGLPELESVYASALVHLQENGAALAEKTNISLDLLETYATLLSNPQKTLKQAHKLLESLAEQTHRLNQELDQSPKTDDRLKQIITQLTAMVQVEQIKLTRGDYTDLT
ncbi:MAG: hypothetical protein KKF12_22320 [Proteobacteria bacterium]|nr:hypothetical protein [Desulfobacula sp.]MBU3952447.1 hypothetical protein [Pseudomonadota bacterium]MBU4133566.1 hypothetical protein [Pseudomonadota bacterium]